MQRHTPPTITVLLNLCTHLKEHVPPLISSSSGQKLPRKSESFALDKVTHADLQVMITV